MFRNEMLIDHIRELARGQDEVTYNTLIKAADLMENQRRNIEALQKSLEMAQMERNVVTKRMIQLEQELHDTKSELQKANVRLEAAVADMKNCCDCCSICANTDSKPLCEGNCEDCQQDCKCKDCDEKSSNFVWRGTEVQ